MPALGDIDTIQRICAKLFDPSLGRVSRSRSKVKATRDKKTTFSALSAACVRFMFDDWQEKSKPEVEFQYMAVVRFPKPDVGRSSPYSEDMWGRYCWLTNFFPIVDACLIVAKSDKVVRWCADGDFLTIFSILYFSASRVQHVSDLHHKFSLRPHHVWKYGRYPVCYG